ncbi:HAD hydrolase-like protein [Microvirga massiliensis]|uniref:HAD hydrolase-like protein n=1 Tax=Microvirga massiliensis TaxID=1033741 RepID=UPI00062BC647|nr:HAD hydrolase-like protein [Microvirga massiliensis]
MTYRLAIFDFDGTLADTFPWFLRVVNTVADRFRFKRIEEHEVEHLRGCSAREIVKHLEVPPWKMPLIARHMRVLAAQEIDLIHLFDGVTPMLRRLSEAGFRLAIVSSNDERNVQRILGAELAGLVHQYECGASIFGKAAKFKRVLRSSGVPATEAICIGDEIRDHEAATAAGLRFGAVTWGFTRGDVLRALQPAAVFETPQEITAALLDPSQAITIAVQAGTTTPAGP